MMNRKKFAAAAAVVVGSAVSAYALPPVPPPPPSTGPDVVVSGIGNGTSGVAPFGEPTGTAVTSNGTIGGIAAYSVATVSCNVGNQIAIWIENTNQHPVIGTQAYRYRVVNGAGQFEQIGINWLKHGFCALDAANCTQLTSPFGGLASNPSCDWLGLFATDTYSAGLNGQQANLGPRSEVNPWTGAFLEPFGSEGVTGNSIFKRTQIKTSDLTAGSNYLFEVVYIATDEPAANRFNNYSYRQASLTGTAFTCINSTEAMRPAIVGWKEKYDSTVNIRNIDPNPGTDGRIILGYKVTQTGPSTWHYEYNVFNMNNHNSVRSFNVPVDSNVTLSNVEFNDVDYHSGEPYSLTDWTFSNGGGNVNWATQTFAQNANANAIRWSTMYSFRFDANVAPTNGTITLGMFRDGASVGVTNVQIPSVPPPPTPGDFALLTPADNSTTANNTPTLTWATSANATSYDVEVSSLSGPVAGATGQAGTSFNVPAATLLYASEYSWTVVANNGLGSTDSTPRSFTFFTPPSPCQGDINLDGSTNTLDLTILLGNFGATVPANTGGDLNGDGTVDTLDLTNHLGGFGCTP